MLDLALLGTLALMGLLSLPHCALMCGAPCAAVTGRGGAAPWQFQLGRVLGYALLGALGVAVLGALREAGPLLRPLWTLLQVALLALGGWLLITARWPTAFGRVATQAPSRLRAPLAGLLWAAWPCGLLQGALLTAALANSPAAGAAAMAAFALASSPGLLAAPALLRRLAAGREAWAARLAGVLLVGSAAWALGHGLWLRVAALCGL